MRTPNQITVDRALVLYVLHLTEPHGLLSDVKLQQLCFLCRPLNSYLCFRASLDKTYAHKGESWNHGSKIVTVASRTNAAVDNLENTRP